MAHVNFCQGQTLESTFPRPIYLDYGGPAIHPWSPCSQCTANRDAFLARRADTGQPTATDPNGHVVRTGDLVLASEKFRIDTPNAWELAQTYRALVWEIIPDATYGLRIGVVTYYGPAYANSGAKGWAMVSRWEGDWRGRNGVSWPGHDVADVQYLGPYPY